jgi:Domain of unknown function (DUF3883)
MDSRRPRLINSYALENAAQDPASDTDAGIAGSIAGALESAAGFQSNPLIRRAIEEYAMAWAEKHLTKLQYAPVDTHKNKPYHFLCEIDGTKVFVEVKGMQDAGKAISLTPREVTHAQKNRNSALFIVHSVTVKGKRKPIVSGGNGGRHEISQDQLFAGYQKRRCLTMRKSTVSIRWRERTAADRAASPRATFASKRRFKAPAPASAGVTRCGHQLCAASGQVRAFWPTRIDAPHS